MPSIDRATLGPLVVPEIVATHRTHTDAAPHAVTEYPVYVSFPARVIAMRYQVTTTIANNLVAAQIQLAIADYDGSSNLANIGDPVTLTNGLAAGNTVREALIAGGQGVELVAGRCVIARVVTAGTDGAGVAGSVKIWAVIQPTAM